MKVARIKFILFLCFCWGSSHAQIGASLGMDQRIYKTSHHSPEAAALGKYGEIPVSLHTGVPDISVPIYLIELPDLQIPISLNYHAGGIKVEEVASNVGLGWSLSYGGVINQVKNGMNDFTWNLGWLHTSEKVDSMMSLNDEFVNNNLESSLTPAFSYAIRSSLKHVDSEADLFSYSFPGQSGKFYFNQSAKCFFMPKNKNRLELSQGGTSPVADNITITDEKGNRFIFSDIVSTTIVKHGSSQGNLSPAIAWAALNLDNNDYNYSYYLTQIITKNSDTVKYTYAPGSSIFRNQYTESRSKNIPGGMCPEQEGSITYTESFAGELRVTEIITSRGQKVQFTYDPTARRDLNGSNTALKGIKILSDNKIIKEYSLTHDYFNGTFTSTSPDDFRLKLLSVTESGKPAYNFKYKEGIPNRLSFAQDHWGYYNAAGNTTLLPLNITKGFFTGANREVTTWAANVGVLEEMEYPTGGKTVFDYESNDCKIHDTVTVITPAAARALSAPGEAVEVSITIPPGAYEIKAFWNAPNVTGTEYVRLVSPTTSYVLNCTASSPVNGVEHNIPPGNYAIQVYEDVNSSSNYYFRLTWNESHEVDTTYNRLVGGLRVKSIKSFSNKSDQTPAVSKFYSYKSFGNPAYSSGLPGLLPKYEYMTRASYSTDGGVVNSICPYINQVSSSVTPLGIFQGGNVAYDNIAVSEDSLGHNGLSRYYYRNSDYFKGFDVFPFSPMMFKDWKNGRLEQTVQTGKSASTAFNVAKSRNEYYTDEHDSSSDVLNILYGIEYILKAGGSETTPATYTVKFGLATYYHFSGESRIVKEEKIDFSSQSQQDSIVTVKRYYYDNASHPFPTRMETESSNKLLLTKVKYPLDYDTSAITNAADKGITLLARRNILSAPVETYAQVRKNGSNDSLTTAGVLNYYNPNKPLLDSIAVLNIGSPISSFVPSSIVGGSLNKSAYYKTEAIVSLYDDRSNVLEQRFKNKSTTESLIWDYKQQYPVAQVQNATYGDIAFTSFEAEGKGNWSFSGTVGADITAPTGRKVYNISTGAISKSVSAAQTYIVSYWTTSATPYAITGTQSGYPIMLRSYNGWNYYEHKVAGVSSISLSGNGYIDELRLYPSNAQMATYTYDPHIGITSECSAAGKIQYYQYDALNRLYVIKDQFGKILKQYDYQYQVPITQ